MIDERLLRMQEMARGLNQAGIVDNDGLEAINNIVEKEKRKVMRGEEIKALRARLGLSQSQLAKKMNMSCQSVQKWERNENHPTGAALILLQIFNRKGLDVLDH